MRSTSAYTSNKRKTISRSGAVARQSGLATWCGWGLLAVMAVGGGAVNRAAATPAELSAPGPFRGSAISYRNVVSCRSFARDAQLTYNPYYAMELRLTPAFAFTPRMRLSLDVAMTRELTRSDTTTRHREVVLRDIYLETAPPTEWMIPVLKLFASPAVRWYVPTSKVSRARTLLLAVRPTVSLGRRFDVFDGLALVYGVSVEKRFHQSTTARTDVPLMSPPAGSSRTLESFTHTGLRNVGVLLINALSLRLRFRKRFGAALAVAVGHGFLYRMDREDARISYSAGPDTAVRYEMMYSGELTFRPYGWLTLALGFTTQNPQLASDATYETPFFNRHTALFFDLRLGAERLSRRLPSRGRK